MDLHRRLTTIMSQSQLTRVIHQHDNSTVVSGHSDKVQSAAPYHSRHNKRPASAIA